MRTARAIQRYRDFSGGMQEFTSPLWVDPSESPFTKAVDPTVPGKLKKGLGYSELGSSGGTDKIKGLFVFDRESSSRELLKVFITTIEKWTGAAWSSIYTSLTNNSTDKAEAISAYVDDEERIYIVTGHNDNLTYYNGTTVSTIADTKAKFVEFFLDRIYIANCKLTSTTYPIRVQYSAIGADTFNTSRDYFDDMGEPITGLKVYGAQLYIFTENKAAAWDGVGLRFIPGNYGCPAGRSVKVASGRLFWFNRRGVYMYAGAELPTLISRPIQGVIDAIADVSAVSGGVDSQGRYYLYLGSVTYAGTSYSNLRIVYDPMTNNWHLDPDKPFGVSTEFKDAGGVIAYAGDVTTAKVWTVDGAQGLAGSALASEWRSAPLGLELGEEIKDFYKVYITHKPQNVSEYLTFQYRINGESSWNNIAGTTDNVSTSGTLNYRTDTLKLPPKVKGQALELRMTHSSSSAGFEIYEIAIEYSTIINDK